MHIQVSHRETQAGEGRQKRQAGIEILRDGKTRHRDVQWYSQDHMTI